MDKVAGGINLVLTSLLVILLVVLLTIVGLSPGTYRLGSGYLQAANVLAWVSMAVGLAGRAMCLSAPVGVGFVRAAVVCDLLAITLALGEKPGGQIFTTLSLLFFLGFTHCLARHLHATEVQNTVVRLAQVGVGGSVLLVIGAFAGNSPAAGVLMLGGSISILICWWLYLRTLQGTVRALRSCDTHGTTQVPQSFD